jgi:periplasmic copper chaperone A
MRAVRSHRRAIRVPATIAIAAAAVVASAAAAGAHVTIVPSSAAKGGFEILSFSVPNERDNVNTTAVEVDFPVKNPIPSVSVKPMTGWTITTESSPLAKPIQTDEGTVTEAVTKVTWTATAGGLEPGQFDLFTISAGPLPTKPNKLTFKALQTYSNGEVVRWIEPVVKGTPEPEFPAPALTLTKAASDHGH